MKQKRRYILTLSLVSVVLFFIVISCTTSNSPTDSTAAPVVSSGLLVSAVTSTAGGSYSPRNVVAIWIENSSGAFVKTLTVKAAARKSDLTGWESSSKGNTVDATTGATLSSYGTIYGTWNGTDVNGSIVADGTYKVCMELTDKNGSGNFSTFTFTKGSVADTQNPDNVPSFSSISIKWLPL